MVRGLGGSDHETIEATVSNSGDALKAIARLREALQTLPFFGSGKVVWLRDCNFLGDERAASAAAVTETLTELAEELKTFAWQNVRLLISAGKVDKRKSFYKTLDKIGAVESFAALGGRPGLGGTRGSRGANGRPRTQKGYFRGGTFRTRQPRRPETRGNSKAKLKKSPCSPVTGKKSNSRLNAICSRNKTARAFALGDALGDRDLPRLLRRLDEELWEAKFDKENRKSACFTD